MELRRYLYIFRRHRALIAITVVVAVAIGFLLTSRVRVYQAKTTLYVGPPTIVTGNGSQNLQGIDPFILANEISLTYSKMIQSRETVQTALTASGVHLSVNGATAELSAGPEIGTQLIQISVIDADPNVATNLANAVADAFLSEVRSFNPSTQSPTTPGLVPQFPVYLFERAIVPTTTVPTGLARSLELSAIFGLVAACGLALLVEYLDLTIRGRQDAQRRLELPVLGVIPARHGA